MGLFFLGARAGCAGLRFAAVLYRAGTGAIKELNPLHPMAQRIRYFYILPSDLTS
jgi:hypothetical protein